VGAGSSQATVDVMYFSKKKTWDEFKKRAIKILKEN
jgi:hypothetical protein